MKRFTGRTTCLFLLVLTSAGAAFAQRVAPFKVEKVNGTLDLQYDFEIRDNNKRGTASSHELEESLNLTGEAYVFHPRVLDLDMALDLGAAQNYADTGARSRSSSSGEKGYALHGQILKEHPYPMKVYLRSRTLTVPQAFGGHFERHVEDRGASFNLRHKILPLTVNYQTNESRTEGLALNRESDSTRFNVSTHFSLFPSKRFQTNSTSLQYVKVERDEFFAGRLSRADRSEVHAHNAWQLRHGKKVLRLNSLYRRNFDTGTSPTESRSWKESFYMKLGEGLDVGAGYADNSHERQDVDTRDELQSAWIHHRLFKSLTTSLRVDRRRSNFDPGVETEDKGEVSVDYTKALPADSRLYVKTSVSRSEVDNESPRSTRPVFNEKLIIDELFSNFLANPDVVTGSVAVWDEPRTTIYSEGIDYELRTVGRRTEIVPDFTVADGIVPGQTLSVDYSIRVDPSIRYENRIQNYILGTSLFRDRYRLNAQILLIDRILHEGNALEFSGKDRHNYRLNFAADWQPFKLDYDAGYEWEEDLGNEYSSRTSLRYAAMLNNHKRLTMRVTHELHYFDETAPSPGGDLDHALRLSAHVFKRFNRFWSGNLFLNAGQRWGRTTDTTDMGVEGLAEYGNKLLDVAFKLEYRRLLSGDDDQQLLAGYIHLSRRLF